MRLIPVLDLKGGVVVRGIGGRRDEYRPVQSVVSRSADPVDVACGLRERFGFREFYIADLDAIAGEPPHRDVLCALVRHDLRLLVDAGLRDVAAGRALLDVGVMHIIAALETSPGPDHLRSLVEALGPERVMFSVDMKAGSLLTAGDGWAVVVPPLGGFESMDVRPPEGGTPTQPEGCTPTGASAALDVASQVLECRVRSLILLDLAGVGEGRGVPTLELCRAVRELSPDVEIITGGGVRGAADLEALERAGVDGVLIASALHNGALRPDQCIRYV